MSMILDALTRAEQERQIEKQPNLKFVTPVKQRRKNSNSAWIWITAALIANAVILAIFLNPTTPQSEQTQIALNDTGVENRQFDQNDVQPASASPSQSLGQEEGVLSKNLIEESTEVVDRPLAMELEASAEPQIDRPLIYESKQDNEKPAQVKTLPKNNEIAKASVPKKGSVSFSEEELSIDEFEQPTTNAPKLLIDQGGAESSQNINTSRVPNLKDLPLSSRSSLSKFEVNVHVYDDNPQNRFVLINMDKYKEGDRVTNNGPLVEEITRNGVVVDYGSGKVLLPPK